MKFKTIDISELDSLKYSLLICALGFEKRSTAISMNIAAKSESCVAIGFDHNLTCSYVENEKWFNDNNFLVIPNISTNDFAKTFELQIHNFFEAHDKTEKQMKLAIDISCFDRRRMAEILQFLISNSHLNIEVDFWYCIGQFQPPDHSMSRNEVAGPIHRKYTGRFTEPGKPLALIAGLGYEAGRVIGAAEYLQVSNVITLLPDSPISEYLEVVKDANETMLQEIDERRVLQYDVTDPARTIAMIDSVIRGLSEDYNIILLPGGPKIFALCSLVAGSMNKQIGVWRVSSCSSLKPNDVLPSGNLVGLRLTSNALT